MQTSLCFDEPLVIVTPKPRVIRPNRQVEVINWARCLMEGPFVVLDTETTGFKSEDEIVQIAIIDLDAKILVSSYIKPLRLIDEKGDAYKINRIGNETVENAPTFPEIHSYLDVALSGKTVVIYNAPFDYGMLNNDCSRHRLPCLQFKAECAMKQFAKFVGEQNRYGYKPHKLQKACSDMGVTDIPTHDGLADTLATLALIKALAEVE